MTALEVEYDLAEAPSRHARLGRVPQARAFSRFERASKRAIDLMIAIPALVLAVPVGVVVACFVAVSSPGPVFFVQERVGRGGRSFRMIKFRTMQDGTDREVQACEVQRSQYSENDFKLSPDDPRITKVGRVLRPTSLDELPQLVNVLLGHMSVVGIRPLLAPELGLRSPREIACYQSMKPGMTGLWQVTGRSTVRDSGRRALDVAYVERWSFWSDVKIMLRTPTAVLRFCHAA